MKEVEPGSWKILTKVSKARRVLDPLFGNSTSDVFLLGVIFVIITTLEPYLSRTGFLGILLLSLFLLSKSLDARSKENERELQRLLEFERAFVTIDTPRESAYWFSKIIGTYWEAVFEPMLADSLYKSFKRTIEKSKPSFIQSIHFDSFALGHRPPKIDNFQVVGTTTDGVKSLEFDVDFKADDFRWMLRAVGSDEFAILGGKNFTFSIVSLEIRMRIRLYLFKNCNIMLMSLTQKPDIYKFEVNLLGISPNAIPFFDIRKFLEAVIANAIVEPKRVPISLSSTKVPPVAGSRLRFDILSCSGMDKIDKTVAPRLQVKVEIVKYKRESEVADGENPDFNETFEARIDTKTAKIKIRLIHYGKGGLGTCIGEKMIQVMCGEKDTTTYWLKDPSGVYPIAKTLYKNDSKGWKVACRLEGMSDEFLHIGSLNLVLYPVEWKYFEEEKLFFERGKKRVEPHSYILKIHRAKDLVAKDRNGFSDPYFKVRYGNYTAKSEVVFRDLAPVYNEVFIFERMPMVETIKIRFWDKDKVQDEALGSLDIPVRILQGEKRKVKEWKELEGVDSGKVLYELSLKKGLPDRLKSRRKRGVSIERDESDTIHLVVHGARVASADRNKKSDPYCIIEYNNSIRKSKVIKKTLAPTWNFISDFDYEPGEIRISIYDWNLVMSRKLLGYIILNASEIMPGENISEKWYDLKGVASGKVQISMERTALVTKEESFLSESKEKLSRNLNKSFDSALQSF